MVKDEVAWATWAAQNNAAALWEGANWTKAAGGIAKALGTARRGDTFSNEREKDSKGGFHVCQ